MTEEKKSSWVNYIRSRIKNNKNALIFIGGSTGSGKSWSGLSICLDCDPTFNKERIVTNIKQLMRLINTGKVKSGNAILWDEAGVDISSRSWQSLTNKMINYLMQTFRSKNFILIFTSPYLDFIDAQTRKLFHAEFLTQGINYRTKKVKLKPSLITYNSRFQKFYYKYLRIKTARGLAPVKYWHISKPPKWLIDEYEEIKEQFTKDLYTDIENQLIKLDGGVDYQDYQDKRKPLTAKQEEVMKLMGKYGDVERVAKELGVVSRSVYDHLKLSAKKGYKPSEFHDKTPEKPEL